MNKSDKLEIIKELARLNPGVDFRYDEYDEKNDIVYCSKAPFQLNLPSGARKGLIGIQYKDVGFNFRKIDDAPKEATLIKSSNGRDEFVGRVHPRRSYIMSEEEEALQEESYNKQRELANNVRKKFNEEIVKSNPGVEFKYDEKTGRVYSSEMADDLILPDGFSLFPYDWNSITTEVPGVWITVDEIGMAPMDAITLSAPTPEKEYSRDDLIKDLIRLNPGVEFKCAKDDDRKEVIYCSKDGSELKLPNGFEHNDRGADEGEIANRPSSGLIVGVYVRDVKNAPKDAVSLNAPTPKRNKKNGAQPKKQESEEVKKLRSLIEKTKKELVDTDDKESKANLQKQLAEYEKKLKSLAGNSTGPKGMEVTTNKKGTFGEVVSCLFGQVDKRFNNFVAKHPKLNERIYKNRTNRYNHPYGYVGWRLISLPIAGFALGLAAIQPWLIPVGVTLGVFGTQAIGKFAAALIRRATKNPPVKFTKVELTKGSYLNNLKNAWNKFKKPKKAGTTNPRKPHNSKPNRKRGGEVREQAEVTTLLDEFNNSVNELDLNNISLQKYDYCNNRYKLLEKKGLLGEISQEVKDKYTQYEGKINEFKSLAKEFVDKVNELDINNINKAEYDRCQFIYNALKGKFGKDVFKNIPNEVMEKFTKYSDALNNKGGMGVEIDNPYIKALLQQVYGYDLKTNKTSVVNCQKLLSEIDKKIPATSDIRNNPKYDKIWKKYNHLKQELVIKTKVLSFVETVQSIKNSKDVSYVEFKKCMDIVNSFGETEWKDFDSLSNASDILSDFQNMLRNSREFILNQKLEELNIDKCIGENNYEKLVEIVKLASDYEKEAKKNHKAQPMNKLSEKARLKLERVRQIVNAFGKFNAYKLDVNLTVNLSDNSIKANYVNYDGEEIVLILETKYSGSIEEVTRSVINEINAIEPLVSVDKINIHGLKYVKEASNGSHRK